mgnify:CR=1 FL=1
MSKPDASVEVARINAKSQWKVAVIGAVAGGLLTLAGTAAVAYLEFINRGKELNLELAKLSLTILAGEYDPDADQNPLPARRFAIRALAAGTGVTIPDEDIETWARTGATPIDPNAEILNPPRYRNANALPIPPGALNRAQLEEQFGLSEWAFSYLDPRFEGGEYYLDGDRIPSGTPLNSQPILTRENSVIELRVVIDGDEIVGEYEVRLGHVTIVGIDREGISPRGPFPLSEQN